MVFSGLFGKKRDKQEAQNEPGQSIPAGAPERPDTLPSPLQSRQPASSRPAETQLPAAPSTIPGAPSTIPGAPSTIPGAAAGSSLSARDVARATAEKIDRIESEMALDYTARNTSAASATAPAPGTAPAAHSRTDINLTASMPRRRRPPGTATTVPSLGQSTDILLGDSILANAMELSDSTSNPAIEEAAILYANGQAMPAVAVLQDAIRADASGVNNAVVMQPWLMLFELLQVLGRKTEFENLGIDFAVRFETAAPGWVPELVGEVTPPARAANRAVVTFAGVLDGGVLPQLDLLKRLAQKNPVLWLEFDKVTAVEPHGADLMLRVFAAFQKSNHEVVLQGCAHLSALCQKSIEVGRRDPSNAIWMLLLETYRLLDRRAAFEESGIDYCVTYEVSPPSWEPASSRFRIDDSHAVAALVEEADEVGPDTIALRGDLLGKLETELQRLNAFASVHDNVAVDCSRLRRVDFTAAGALLNWAVGMQGAGSPVRFLKVGHLIAALFVVMGLHEVAQIERKSA